MKSPSMIPTFRGLDIKDPYAYLFEVEVLWRNYEYMVDVNKLKLFPSVLKDSTMHWFTSLPENLITNWGGTNREKMKVVFLEKYQDYC